MFCAVCGTPVFEVYGTWFHDVGDRFIATPARTVTDYKGTTINLPAL